MPMAYIITLIDIGCKSKGEGALGEKSSHPVDTNSQRGEIGFVLVPTMCGIPINYHTYLSKFQIFRSMFLCTKSGA